MKIAFFGAGLMGKPMALRLIRAGYDVTVYNRTQEKTEFFKKMGVTVAKSVREAVESSDLLITMLSDYPAICETLLIEPSINFKGKTCIQMSTISSKQSVQLKDHFENNHAQYIEAPVLGSIPQVETGTLLVLFGGSRIQFKQWDELLSHFGEKRIYLGPVGRAMATKLALNQLIVSLTTAFSMSLGYLEKSNISIDIFMDILRNSALYAPTFDKKLTRMRNRNFQQPNFPVKHLLKDLNLILDEFKAREIETGPLNEMADILSRTIQAGYSEQDYSALYNTVNPIYSSTIGSHK